MAQHTVHTQASRGAVRQAVLRIPQEMRGGTPAAQATLVRVGMVVLGRIKQAYVTKSRGGTDEAGDRWEPLKPATIAYSRTRSRGRGGRTQGERDRPSRPSRALNTRQQQRWWDVYRQGLVIYDGDKGRAAARAWLILKEEGAVTLFDKYGSRTVEILRDTGVLFNSLSPGLAPGSVFRPGPGEVIIGTNVPYAAAHHHGVPGRLPQRRLWPEPGRWPVTWWADITAEARDGIVAVALDAVRSAR